MSSPLPPPDATNLDNRVSVFGYLFLCLNVFLFSSILVADHGVFNTLTREDHLVESFTAIWYLLAGFLLFATAWMEGSFFRRCVYILGGMTMLLGAGEEISWGQRIFGFATPDFLMGLNEQNEFTVHNIANGVFALVYLNGALILCMITSAAFFYRKGRLFGIPLPSILLMLGFLIMISYASGAELRYESATSFREYVMTTRGSFGFILIEEKGLLALFLIFALFSKQVKLVIASAATLAVVLALLYVSYRNVSGHGEVVVGGLYEMREYLFGIACLFYSLELVLAQGRLSAISRVQFSFSVLKLAGRRVPFWLRRDTWLRSG